MTSYPNRDAAQKASSDLVTSKLAACVQEIGPVCSTYLWDGSLKRDEEWVLHIKTTQERVPEVQVYLRANHSYDIPECVVVPISDGSLDYLDWVSGQTRR
ncbi:divalent-cation tolerance protein CutA [bacterium]|nr:divalent-cation tolerance protein CutA [bacterium]